MPELTPAMVEHAVSRFKANAAATSCANDPDRTVSVNPETIATKVCPNQARVVFEWPAANDATLEYSEPLGDLDVVKLRLPQTNAALDGILRATQSFMDANAAFVHGRKHQAVTLHHNGAEHLDIDAFDENLPDGTTYEDLVDMTDERTTTAPTYMITPVTIPPGQPDAYPAHHVATPRVIFEVEHHTRNAADMLFWGAALLEDPLVSAFVGIMVYHRYDDGTFAMLAAVIRRNDMRGAYLHDLVSFGTRPLHPKEMEYVENDLWDVDDMRVLPCPRLVTPHVKHQSPPAAWAGLNPTITVPGRDVFWQSPAPSVDPLPNLMMDLWPILDEVAALYNP